MEDGRQVQTAAVTKVLRVPVHIHVSVHDSGSASESCGSLCTLRAGRSLGICDGTNAWDSARYCHATEYNGIMSAHT